MSFSIGEIGTLPTLMFSVGGDYHDTSQSEDFDAELDLSYES